MNKTELSDHTLSFSENLSGSIGLQHHKISLTRLKIIVDSEAMHAVIAGGYLNAPEFLREELSVIEGRFRFFEPCGPNHKTMHYEILLRGSKSSEFYRLQGEKHLSPRRMMPWRLLDIWPDTTTVSIRLWHLEAKNVNHQRLLGMGIISIGVLSFIRQVWSIRANPALPLVSRMTVVLTFLYKFASGLMQSYRYTKGNA